MSNLPAISPRIQTLLGTILFAGCALFLYAHYAHALTLTFSATPGTVAPGGAVTIQWNARPTGEEGIPTCTGTNFSTGGARTGSVTVNPTVTTTYSINCDGVVQSRTVTVTSAPLPTVTMTADPTSILYGESTRITWSTTNATFCSDIRDATYTEYTYATNGATSGSVTVTPAASSDTSRIYSMNCSGPNGSRAGSVTITAQHGVTAQLYVGPPTIQSGNSAYLEWQSQYATSCTGTNFSTGGATSGNVTVSPTQTTTYSVTCTGSQGSSASDSKVLGVNGPPIDMSCSAAPSPSNVGQTVTWNASAWGGTAPYSFSWAGEHLDGLTGSSVQATYATPGVKGAVIEVTDSWSSPGGWRPTSYDNQRCTGPVVGGGVSDIQDGGVPGNMFGFSKALARSLYNDLSVPPADFHTNPGNYCVESHVAQSCDPAGNSHGAGGCRIGIEAQIHSGNGRRAVTSSDYSYTVDGWQIDKFYAATVYNYSAASGGRTVSHECTNHTVNANAPDAVLTAAPTSVVAGNPATLTHSCTNSTSASIDQGVGAVTPTNPPGAGVTVTPTVTTTYTLTCTGSGGTDTSMATVTVTPALPDLTAGSVFPGSATVGVPVTLSALITNSGPGGISVGFNDLFQRATDSSGSGATDIATYSSAGIAAGANNTATRSYTFPSSGTWYVRACADKSSAGDTNGAITESSETNNCGPWTAFTISDPAGSSLSCNVSPSSLPAGGGSVTYTASGGSTPYTWNDSLGGSYGTGSSVTRNLSANGTYAMTVSKSGFTSGNCPMVTVGTTPTCGTPDVRIWATPDRVRRGGSTVITWTASNIDTSCTITGTDGYFANVPATGCVVPGGGASFSRTINDQETYTISCDGGERTAQAVVNIPGNFIEF